MFRRHGSDPYPAPISAPGQPSLPLFKQLLILGASLFGIAILVTVLLAGTETEPTEASGIGSKWVDSAEAGQDSNEAESQPENHCEGTLGIPAGLNPGWVRVGGSGDPSAPIVKAEGQVLDPKYASLLPPVIEPGKKTNAWVNFTDNTLNHWARDFNVFLTLDKKDRHLLSFGQFIEGDASELGNFEIEWERGTIPPYAMPAVGDRMTVWGAHIWDCGHGDTWAEGLYAVPVSDLYRNEIHPPMGWVVYRRTADADSVPTDAKKVQDPWIWYEPSDNTGMATTLPNTGLLYTPVQATVADAYFSSYGGNAIESLNGCDNDSGIPCHDKSTRPELHLADSYEWQQRVLDNDYPFFLPLPPKPANAPLWTQGVWDVEERCAEIPPDPTWPDKNLDPENTSDGGVEGESSLPGQYYWADKGIGGATCNPGGKPYAVVPTVQNGQPGFLVTVRAKTGHDGVDGTADDPVYPNNDYVAFAYRFKAAWDVAPPQPAPTYLVQFDDMRVYNDSDDCGNDGEWVMTLRVNEQSIYPVNGEAKDDDDSDMELEPFWEVGAIDDALCDGGPDNEYKTYNLGYRADTIDRTVSLAPGQAIEIWDRTYDKDPSADHTFDVIDDFSYPALAVGQTATAWHGFPNDQISGAHTIEVHTTNVTPQAIAAGSLVFGQPQFGPDLFTSDNLLRVSGKTPVSIMPALPADGVEYRLWLDGTTPATWHVIQPGNDVPTVSLGMPLAGLPSGNYHVEWAALNQDAASHPVVGERKEQMIQVDNDAPTFAVPGDISVEATETGGAHVPFVVQATDNYNPQPVFGSPNVPNVLCDHSPGALFPNGLNGPRTTVVNCTATDTVGNTALTSFKVTVYSPFGYLIDFVIMGWQWSDIGARSEVWTGNMGAYDSADGIAHAPDGYTDIELATANDAVIHDHSKQAAESVWLGAGTHAQGVYWVDEFNTGKNATYTSHAGYVPLWACPAAFPVYAATGNDLTFGADTGLIPGNWGRLTVKPNVKLHVVGGDYYFKSINLQPGARLEVEQKTRFFVTGQVGLGNKTFIGPKPGSSVAAHDIVMYVAGGAGASAPAFGAGHNVVIWLNLQASSAGIRVGDQADAKGAFLAPTVQFGSRATLHVDSIFKADPCSNYPPEPPPPPECRDGSGVPIPCPSPTPSECFDSAGRPVPCPTPTTPPRLPMTPAP